MYGDGHSWELTFVSQLIEIAILTALERTPGGKSSEGIIQLTHPVVKVILFPLLIEDP